MATTDMSSKTTRKTRVNHKRGILRRRREEMVARAKARQEARAKRSPREQMRMLDKRGATATKERARLTAQIEEQLEQAKKEAAVKIEKVKNKDRRRDCE